MTRRSKIPAGLILASLIASVLVPVRQADAECLPCVTQSGHAECGNENTRCENCSFYSDCVVITKCFQNNYCYDICSGGLCLQI
jgi:hypothetical protein